MKIKKGALFAFGVVGFVLSAILAFIVMSMGITIDSYPLRFDKFWIGCILSVAFLIAGCCMIYESYSDNNEKKEEKK
jgi:putative Mn2+ efflux pump MntP